jgi:hypothetical protein
MNSNKLTSRVMFFFNQFDDVSDYFEVGCFDYFTRTASDGSSVSPRLVFGNLFGLYPVKNCSA